MANSPTSLGPGSIGLPGTDPARRELLRRGQLSFRVPSQAHFSIAEGSVSITILAGTSQRDATVTHNLGWKSTGRVWLTIQNHDTTAGAERPISAHVYQVGVDSFGISVAAHANVAADRVLTVAWLASGILP